MHPPSKLFSTAAMALLFLGVTSPTPETTTTSATLVRTSISDRTSEDTRSLRAMDAPTHAMTELNEDRFFQTTSLNTWLKKSENPWKSILAKTTWKDSFYEMLLKELLLKISPRKYRYISRQKNPTAAQLKSREELLGKVAKGTDVSRFDDWLEGVVNPKNDGINLFDEWIKAKLEPGYLKTLLQGAGKGDDVVVYELAQAFRKHVNLQRQTG